MEEIENYFLFLTIFDEEETRLYYKIENEFVREKIQFQFQTTLLANGFLILYNLIESTIRNSIIAIYKKVKAEELNYKELSNNLQKLWIKQTTDNLKEGNYRPDTLRQCVYNLVDEVLKNETIMFSEDKMDFSGNLDADKIRDLANKIGFETSQNGRNLVEIKNKRNRLAHGEQTFYDVGKDFSVKELHDFKKETFSYLYDVIDKIERYIRDENFKNK